MSPTSVPHGFTSFEVELHKAPVARLGLDVLIVSVHQYVGLLVEAVSEGGVVDTWNRRNDESVNVRPGDFIVRVNSVSGDAKAVADELRQGIKLNLTVHRGTEDCPQIFRNLQASAAYKRHGRTAAAHQALLNMGALGPTAGAVTPTRAQQPQAAQQTMQEEVAANPPVRPPAAAAAGLLAMQQQQQQQQPLQQQPIQQQPPMPQPPMPAAQAGSDQAPSPEDLPQATWAGRRVPAPRLPAFAQEPAMAPSPGPGNVPEPCLPMGGPGGPPVQRRSATDLPSSDLLNPNSAQPGNGQFTFEAVLTRQPGMVLGMELLPVKAGLFSGLWVEVVCKGGMVDAWNQSNPPAYNIRPGDCIVHVNGVSSDSPAMMMMEELCTRQEMRITVRRSAGGMGPLVANSEGFGVAGADSNPMTMVTPNGLAGGPPGGGAAPPIPPRSGLAAGMTAPMGARNARPHPGMGGPPFTSPVVGNQGNYATDGQAGNAPGLHGRQWAETRLAVPPQVPPSGLDLGSDPMVDLQDEDYGSQSLALALPSRNMAPAPPSPAPQEPVFSFDVDIKNRPGMRLGLEVMLVSNGTCGLVIRRVIEGGLMSQWNERRNPPFRVQSGDYILQVNGIGCWDTARMAEEFSKEHQTLNFTIQRGGHGGGAMGVSGPCRPCPGQMQQQQQHPPMSRPTAPPQPGFMGRDADMNGVPDTPPGLPVPNISRPVAPSPQPQAARRMLPEEAPKAPPPPPPVLGRQNPDRGWHNMPGLPAPGQSPVMPMMPQRSQEATAQSPPMRPTSGPTSDTIPRTRILRNLVTPPGGPGTGPSPFGGPISRVGEAVAEAPDDFDINSTRQLTQLFQSTLQLNDEEMSQLFREALQRRPWLRGLVAQALGVL